MYKDGKHPTAVIYIEDDPEMIELVTLILTRRGFSIIGALDGQQGLDLIERNPPDLILLDLMMPGLDGWDVYHQLKAKEATKNTPVIIITAKAQPIDRVLGISIAKVDAYISKPFRPQELLEAIETIIKNHGPV
jgi:two-component system, OmpR family, response regulator VicR